MLRDEFGHLEHAHLALAIKYRLELVVGVDHDSFLFVLQTTPLDVCPKLFCKLRPRERLRTDDGSKLIVRLARRHDGGSRFALASVFGSRPGGCLPFRLRGSRLDS